MQLTPREFDKLLIYMMADVALKRKTKGLVFSARDTGTAKPLWSNRSKPAPSV
jgi:urease gamma subunit